MQLAMIGLGRMGGNMTERLLRKGHSVVAYDRTPDVVAKYQKLGATGANDLAAVVGNLSTPRVIWIMVPAGDPVDQTIATLAPKLSKGDVIIDGGNSNFHDSIRRGRELASSGIEFIDAGTSGGIWGLENGYCLMVGGSDAAVSHCEPIFRALAPDDGYAHVGPTGAGHYVKMVHNGIEYAMMQSYAEGFEIMQASPYDLDLAKISHLWNQGSVVRSWLLELTAAALAQNPKLEGLAPYVEDSGEGRWTVDEAINSAVPAPVIALSLMMRFRSRQENAFGARMLSAMRNAFGGHAVKKQ